MTCVGAGAELGFGGKARPNPAAEAPVRCLAILFTLAAFAAPAAADAPTAKYKTYRLQDFTVRVSPEAARHKAETDALLRAVDVQLEKIVGLVPDKPLAVLRKVTIWVEWDGPAEKNVVARFFPGSWAVKNLGLNPDKANGIEVPNVNRFVDNHEKGSTWVVMHELAHAYHHLALAKKDGAIQATHKQAVERKLYENVEHFNGYRGRGYAVTNYREYFAVLSEAYFGKSYNFPYDRAGLLRYDTAGYWLMEDAWGKPK